MVTSRTGKKFGWLINLFRREKSGEIDRELPFAAIMFTLMAASGVALYESWKKLRYVDLLPTFQMEAEDVVRQVEVLGYDPLTVMRKKAEQTTSKLYRDFLAGYVSVVKSGGNVVDFLKSKLRSIFEVKSAAAARSIERLGTLVEAYAVSLIMILCVYILFVVISSTSLFEMMAMGGVFSASQPVPYFLIFFVTPLISILLMAAAHKTEKSTLITVKQTYRKAVFPIIGVTGLFAAVIFVPELQSVIGPLGLPCLVTVCLLVISIPPTLSYLKVARTNFTAEEAMPSFLRDVTEARKIGLSPEKSIVHAAKRKEYGSFSELLGLIRGQIEWGVSLKKIFENISKRIQSWPVLINFMILVETIEIGGGSATALEILSEYGEKNRDIEVNKRATLKPYIILAFVWSILIALTTTIVAMTIRMLTQLSLPGMGQMTLGVMQQQMQQQIIMLSVGIIFQCWLSGFFIGKISEGTIAAGFKYSALLAVTAYVSLLLSQNFLWGIFSLIPS